MAQTDAPKEKRLSILIVIMVIGLFFPVGVEIGAVNVTLVDITIVLATFRLVVSRIDSRNLHLPMLLFWFTFIAIAFVAAGTAGLNSQSLTPFIELFEMMFAFYIVYNTIESQRQIEQLIRLFIVLACLNAVLSLGQYSGLVSVGLTGDAYVGYQSITRASGFIGGLFGAFLGMGLLPLLTYLIGNQRRMGTLRRLGIIALIVLIVLGMLATLNRTWLISCGVTLVLIAIRLGIGRLVLLVLLGLVLLYAAGLLLSSGALSDFLTTQQVQFILNRFDFTNSVSVNSLANSRVELQWRFAVDTFEASPWYGHGLGNVHYISRDGVVGLIDNHYLALLAETGILGLASFLSITVAVFYRAVRAVFLARDATTDIVSLILFAILLEWLIGGMSWGLFASGKPGIMFFLIYGIILANYRILQAQWVNTVPAAQTPVPVLRQPMLPGRDAGLRAPSSAPLRR